MYHAASDRAEGLFSSSLCLSTLPCEEKRPTYCAQTEIQVRLSEMSVQLNDNTIPHFLELLRPKLEYYTSLDESMNVLEALKEIQSHDTGADKEVRISGETLELARNEAHVNDADRSSPGAGPYRSDGQPIPCSRIRRHSQKL